jgi:CDP-glucose 4,6-dehydratase
MAEAPQLDQLRGKRVFVTGHTGFKGAWLSTWLNMLGAEVFGLALPPPARGAFHDFGVDKFARSTIGDVRDADAVRAAVDASQPDLVFHLAAQPLVRRAWADPQTTFAVNVMGTVNVVHAALSAPPVRGVVVVTSDKVYENDESGRRFVESDRLGGHDPYSASKAAAELALVPYRDSAVMGLSGAPVVSVRAGNVIGGGDWSVDRLIPDIIRALETGEKIVLRRPDAVRPWQHVLDCVRGYLLVGAATLEARELAPAYNFASDDKPAKVHDVARMVVDAWGASRDVVIIEHDDSVSEAHTLRLDAGLARRHLGWAPALSLREAVQQTVDYYRRPTIGCDQIAASFAPSEGLD